MFAGTSGPIEVDVRGPVKVNNSAGVVSAVLAGAGIGVVPMFTLAGELQRGDLVLVLEGFEPRPLPMSVVYASRRHVSAKIRLAIDFMVEAFG